MIATGYRDDAPPKAGFARVGAAFMFAIETAMRCGEICGLNWADVETTFYTDSINDLSLMENVTHPVATNPDDRLRAIAIQRGWRILDLF